MSLERIVEENKEGYYEALQQSSQNWHEGTHHVVPWWNFFLSTLKLTYKEFENRIKQVRPQQGKKSQSVEAAISMLPEEFTIADLEEICPAVSRESIRLILRKLRDSKELQCSSQGRGAVWQKVGNKWKK
jgi:hypothetical protein